MAPRMHHMASCAAFYYPSNLNGHSKTLVEVDWPLDVGILLLELWTGRLCPLGEVGNSRGEEETERETDKRELGEV